MRIIIFGAGAIGSLFGAYLSKQHDVILIGNKHHMNMINSKGLVIHGKTEFKGKLSATSRVNEVKGDVDLLLLTVKSYDTSEAMRQACSIISKNTIVLTIQNGLNNIEAIQSFIPKNQILAGITTHGVIFESPGIIHHTGIGRTIIGELDGSQTNRLRKLVRIFKNAQISVRMSDDIFSDIWQKAIINSAINPLTSIFKCKNGHLLENPILSHLLFSICSESVDVAKSIGCNFSKKNMLEKTIQVIDETKNNRSSMLQCIERESRTEIDSINGIIVTTGKRNNISVKLNEAVYFTIKQLY